MRNRGPDGEGEFPPTLDAERGYGNVFLAMRRLSIIDLAGGWQPLYNEDQTIALVANGEIYNFVELRQSLEAQGHTFRTHSDCETIVHLYEQYGLDCVHHLRGMFAFALWDAPRRRLVIARDRMGEKPLYIEAGPGVLSFASEMKAILAMRRTSFELDASGVHQYLHYGWVPEPQTIVEGIEKLSPGHMLIVDVDSWHVVDRCYWTFEAAPPIDGDPTKLVRAELETITELVTRSDVPVGIALSGGLDSSVIATLATRRYAGRISAFSVGYANRPRQDERTLAAELAAKLDMPFHEIEIRTEDMLDFFPSLCFLRDDPIADIAGYGYYALSKCAREHGCPVLLQGQGGDELFWGYSWTVKAVEQSLRKKRGEKTSSLAALLREIPVRLSAPEMARVAYLFGGLLVGWKTPLPSVGAPADQLVLHDLNDSYQIGVFAARKTYTPSFAEKIRDVGVAAFFRARQPWEHVDVLAMKLLCRGYLLQNGIAQGDRLSMSNSVELRLPFVDYKLVELVVGLQKNRPSFNLGAKAWLKSAVSDLLPRSLLDRPKRGFNPPVAAWTGALRARYGQSLVEGYLTQSRVLSAAAARNLVRRSSRFGPWNDLFLKYLMLEHWCRGMAGVVG